jgi:eukaryotic-like serine/threonine-protein kinase
VESLVEGTVIADRYQLIRKRGSGGVGSVWLARDLSLDSLCAIKLIDGSRANAAELAVRLEREAKSAAQIRGAHVIDVFEHGIWNEIPFIVMEFLEGEDLGERLTRTQRLSPEETYRIVAQVARALARAHGAGIVHRDMKPDNIFLVPGDEYEIAKVLDFGIARHETYSIENKATKTGTFVGTPNYVSPEQARGKDIDWRSDLWALGIIVFECLTGRPPFISDALGELMAMILYEPILPMTEHNPGLPPAIDVWWERASAREPEQRFQSAKQLADALADALGIEQRLQIPDIVPLGLQQQGLSSVPDVSVRTATPAVRTRAVDSQSGWRSTSGTGSAYRSVPPPERTHLKVQHWLLTAGTVAVISVAAISALSSARGREFVRTVPAMLRISPAATAPAPAIAPATATELAGASAPTAIPRVEFAPEPPASASPKPAAKVAPAVERQVAPRRRPERSTREAPRRARERDWGKTTPETATENTPDYGI